jgi:hypothetical protein
VRLALSPERALQGTSEEAGPSTQEEELALPVDPEWKMHYALMNLSRVLRAVFVVRLLHEEAFLYFLPGRNFLTAFCAHHFNQSERQRQGY